MSIPVDNTITFGIEDVHYAILDESGVTPSYATPVALKNAVSIALNANGSKTPVNADNKEIMNLVANLGYNGNLNVLNVPRQFAKEVLNYQEDANGILYEDADKQPKPFAMTFQFSGDKNEVKHVAYKCQVERPSIEGDTTGETISFKTKQLPITIRPITLNGKKLVKAESVSTDEQYEDWNEAIYIAGSAVASI